ncbi:MAG: efflux RND transporter periplasmic adaptor subunit [Myxococcota bacterium]|jgi:RND family efflux transporter MFP subunit|nr:efflux RND transporter periplasmic adaptor subunit [Myxococcota bacterium]
MKHLFRAFVFLLLIAAGAGVFAWLVSSRQSPSRQESGPVVIPVTTTEVVAASGKAKVMASGTVVPARSVRISAEVPGKVVAVGSRLKPGGRLRKGDLVVRLDVRDYDLAVTQSKAAVAQAQLQLEEEAGRKVVAEKEWSLLESEVSPSQPGRRLALREAQLEMATVALEAARSRMEQAQLSRQRTSVAAPFDALVLDESVEAGQYLQPGAVLATLVASEAFWVRVPLPMDRLPWISRPGPDGKGGSPTRIVQKVSPGVTVERQGRVVELLADLDERGKMARLVVEIPHPLGDETSSELPILLGAYVDVEIEGPALEGMVAIPKSAIDETGHVWRVAAGKLEQAAVTVGWTEGLTAYVTAGLAPGERVLTSRLSTPVEGLEVRDESAQGAKAAAAPPVEGAK